MNNREGAREGTPTTAKLLTIHPQRPDNRVMNMLQAHGTTTHILTKTTTGQRWPQGSPSHMIWTVHDTDLTNNKQKTLQGSQDTNMPPRKL